MTNNFVNACRLCLQENEVSFSLLVEGMVDKIDSLTGIKIHKDDELPKTCCKSCIVSLQKSYKFQQEIIKSDRILKEKLFQTDIEIIEKAQKASNIYEILEDVEIKDEELNNEVNTHVKLEYEEAEIKSEPGWSPLPDQDVVVENGELKPVGSEISIFQKPDKVGTKIKQKSGTKKSSNISYNGNVLPTGKTKKKNGNLPTKNAVSRKADCLDNNERNGTPKEFTCTDCNAKFDHKIPLQRHMLKHKLGQCPICSTLVRSDNLKKHIHNHTGLPEMCEVCGKIFKNKESLRGHTFYYHRDTGPIKCEDCGRNFKVNLHYRRHVKSVHAGIKNHQCHVCGHKFFSGHCLKKHLLITHGGARPYVCSYCKKGFTSTHALKTHTRQHTLETPYRCHICTAGFRQKVSLKTHLKSKHGVILGEENLYNVPLSVT